MRSLALTGLALALLAGEDGNTTALVIDPGLKD